MHMTNRTIAEIETQIAELKQELAEAKDEENNPPHGAMYFNQHGDVFVVDYFIPYYEAEPRMWHLSAKKADQWPVHATRWSWEKYEHFQFTRIRRPDGTPFNIPSS